MLEPVDIHTTATDTTIAAGETQTLPQETLDAQDSLDTQTTATIETLQSSQTQQEKYTVHLPTFEGPLDLLLHLIEKRQMEITAISLVLVTDQYLAYLQQWKAETLPLASMASFISIAARLLYIKSQSLLPHTTHAEETPEMESAVEMAEELQRHLTEYKIAKEIAHILRQREEAGLQTYGRSGLLAGIEAQLSWAPPTLVEMEATKLARAFSRLLELQAKETTSGENLLPIARVRVSERIAEITSRLQERPVILLDDVLKHETSRFVIIVTFIAVLEMWKWQRINISQDELFGPITLERGDLWSQAGQEELEDDL
jgi:segregation and condensation protein A